MNLLTDVNFVQFLLGILLAYVIWSLRRALTSFENSIQDLYEKYGTAESRLTRVETIHQIKGCDNESGKGK